MSLKRLVYREYEFTLAAGAVETLNTFSDTVAILEVTGSVNMRIGNNPETKCREGMTIDVENFEKFQTIDFIETGGSAATVLIAVSNGAIQDNRLTVSGSIDVSIPSGITTPAHVSVAATTTAAVIASNNDRHEALIRNPSTNSDNFLIGDSNATSGRGITLAPGEALVLTVTDAIYAYNAGASAQDIEVMEIE